MKFYITLLFFFFLKLVIAQDIDSVEVRSNLISDSIQNEPDMIKYYQVGEKKVSGKNKFQKVKEDEIQSFFDTFKFTGFFGAAGVKVSTASTIKVRMVGLKAGWTFNRKLAVGLEGYGVIPNDEYRSSFWFTNVDGDFQGVTVFGKLRGGYVGVFMEPIFNSNKRIHLSFPVSAGFGQLALDQQEGYYDENYNYTTPENSSIIIDGYFERDQFGYVEPGANIEFNLSKFLRFDLGVSKRFVKNFDLEPQPRIGIGDLNYHWAIKVGRF